MRFWLGFDGVLVGFWLVFWLVLGWFLVSFFLLVFGWFLGWLLGWFLFVGFGLSFGALWTPIGQLRLSVENWIIKRISFTIPKPFRIDSGYGSR